jgi:hypothetical protein
MRIPALGLATLFMLYGAAAHAGDPVTAEGLFRAGKEALARGDLDAACAKFRESDRADPAPGTLFHLAECEEKRGRIGTSWSLYSEVKGRLSANDERHALVDSRIAALDKKVPRVTLHLADAPEDVVIKLGKTELGAASLDAPLPVDPGKVAVEVRAPGHEPWRAEIEVSEGDKRDLKLSLGPAVGGGTSGPQPQREPETPDEEGGGSNVPLLASGIVLSVLGAGGIAAGIALGAKAKSDADTAGTHCNGNQCDQTGFDIREDARTLGNIGTGVFFGGVALAAGGIAMVLVATLGGDDDEAKTETSLNVRFTGTGARLDMAW